MLDGARLFHVNLNCTNLDRSRRFYLEALCLSEGVRTAPERVQPGAPFGFEKALWDAWILIGEHGFEAGALDLLTWLEPGPVGTPPRSYHQCGFQRIGFGVPDLNAAIDRAIACGGEAWSGPIVHGSPPRSIRLVHLSDPDGVALELFEGRGPGVAFVSVVCADLARSLEWYVRLGFRELARFPTQTSYGKHLHVDGPAEMDEVLLEPSGGGPMHLILTGFTTPTPVPASQRFLNTVGIARVALLVSDIDRAYARLGTAGIECLSEPVAAEMGPGLPALRFLCFAGPDGEILELIEQPG